MKQNLVVFFLCITLNVLSQGDTLNRFNQKGKKDGLWKVYLNQYLKPVDAIENAYFQAYERYDNGQIVFKFYSDKYDWKKFSFKYSQPLPKIGYPEVLNGSVGCYEPNGEIMYQYDFKNGLPVHYKYFSYYANNPKICGFYEVHDWSKKYNDLDGSYYYEAFWDGKLVVVGWFLKDKKKWKLKTKKIVKNSGLLVF